MADKKLNSITFPDLADRYILDAGHVQYNSTDTFTDGTVGKALETKAEIDGYYEEMTVGDAEQLVASQYVDNSVPYVFRTTGGSADVGNRAYVDAIVGGSIAWNQLVQNGNFASTSNWSGSSATFTVSNGVATVVASSAWGRIQQAVNAINGHKYLVRAEIKQNIESEPCRILWSASNTGNPVIAISTTGTTGTDWVKIEKVVNATHDDTTVFSVGSLSTPTTFSAKGINIIDLTQMFGSTVADYIYSLEQNNEGDGVAFFKALFPKDYYAYNAGTLMHVNASSHDTVGFNQWDEEWELGAITGSGNYPSTTNIRSKNYIPCVGGTTYFSKCSAQIVVFQYDENKTLIRPSADPHITVNANRTFTTLADARYMRFYTQPAYGTTYNNDICINLSWSGYRDGEYEAYSKHSYPLDSTLTLRGVPKLDGSNNLYYDGDTYESDGTVTRKYATRTINGSEGITWYFNVQNSLQGVYCAPAVLSGVNTTDRTQSIMIDNFVPIVLGDTRTVGTAYVDSGWLNMIFPADTFSTSAEMNTWLTSNPVTVVYELATPTTETADPYQQIQICNDFGTEEFVVTEQSGVAVPVGHTTRYPANLRDKLQHLPDLATNDGTYAILQSNKQMSLTTIPASVAELPDAPTTDGTYVLKCTVSDGTATYSWVSES